MPFELPPREFIPRAYNQITIEFLLEHERCALWASMGMGKTVSMLNAISCLQLVERNPVLVLAPKRVAQSTWPDEQRKWAHLSDVPVSAVVGTIDQRIGALRTPAAVYTMNYDNLPWLREYLGKSWHFQTIVADESTRLKSFRLKQGGARARALGGAAHTRVKRFYELTGTPSPNGLLDLWGQLWFLDEGERLGRTMTAYKDRWFRPSHDGYGVEPLPFAQEQIQDKVRDICLTLDARDWFDLKEPIVTDIMVELPAQARALYREMEKNMFAQIGERSAEAFNAAARSMKCSQLASGAVYVDPIADSDEHARSKEWREVHDVKLQALESVVEEAAGAPVLAAYQFRSDLARIRKAFPQARVLDDNPQTITDWNAGKIPLLVAHPKSAGHGLNLQDGGNILVFFGHDWNLEEYQQMIERIGPTRQAQSGHDRPVFVYHIIARDTVDEMVMARRAGKRSVQQILLEAMKRKR